MSGSLIVISAPSGAGKTTLVRALLERDPHVSLSVSFTTRAPRTGETDGVDYHFIDIPAFVAKRDAGEFLEWAEVHGHFYATSATWLRKQLTTGQDMLLEIDWQGAQQVRLQFPDLIDIFVLPPSFEALEARLRGRQTDCDTVISNRLAAARIEMAHANTFQYVIVNQDIASATGDLAAIVHAARLRSLKQQQRNPSIFEFSE